MNKIKVVVSAPVDTYSGYGARSRDIVKSLLDLGKYDVSILSQRWGNTRTGYLKDHSKESISKLIIPNLIEQPDVWIQITVPNEFQPVGKYNIGITAGIETDLASAPWVQGCNRMDVVLTSSRHSKATFERSTYDEQDPNTKQVVRSLKIEKPIEVLFEGLDLEVYKKETTNNFDLSDVKETFNFLFVGHWLNGDYGHDRKNVGFMIKSFLATFKNKQNAPGLILKTSMGTSSILSREKMLDAIEAIRREVPGKLPNIYILHGDVTDEDMSNLYNNPKVKAMISFTKGEGFGRPLLEFSATGKPIIASNWSGHTDFLDPNYSSLVGGVLENVHPSAANKDMILTEAKWFKADSIDVGKAYKNVFKHYGKVLPNSRKLGHNNRKNFSLDKMTETLGMILDDRLPKFASKVELNIPSITLPKIK